MTENRAQKQVIRQRQAETGEKYTTALRAIRRVEDTIMGLLRERPRSVDELVAETTDADRPEDVPAVVASLIRARKVAVSGEGLCQVREPEPESEEPS